MHRRCRETGPAVWLETDLQGGETAEVFSRLGSPEEFSSAATTTPDPSAGRMRGRTYEEGE